MEDVEKLQKILDTDSKDGLMGLAAERISELNDSVSKKEAELSEMKKKIADEEEAKKEAEKSEEKEESDSDKEEKEEVKDDSEVEKLKEENASLKEKLAETEKKVDAIVKLQESQTVTDKKVDAISRKIVRPLIRADTDKVAELKEKRMSQYNDSVKKFKGDQ